MERKWSVRAYNQEDEEKLLELWKAVYPKLGYYHQHWAEWWRWKYKDNPAGAGKIWIAEHDGKIVGHYAIIPIVAKLVTDTVTISQSVDTMTHPDYRRQGLFKTLAREVYSQAEGNGIDIVCGFPGANSLPGFIERLDWFNVTAMPLIFKPSNWGNALKLLLKNRLPLKLSSMGGWLLQKLFYRVRKLPVVEGLTVTQVPCFDERINELWDRVSSQHEIAIMRNKKYLNWRYAIPGVEYTIYIAEKEGGVHGYVVLRCMPREQAKAGIIFDILAESEEIAQCLVAKAVEHCEQEKVDLIYAGMRANEIYLKALRRNGFMYLPSFIKLLPFIVYSTSQHISKEFLKEPKNWLVQIGDSDLI